MVAAKEPEKKSSDPASEEFFSSADNRLVLLPVDPYWALAYWSIHPRTIEMERRRVKDGDAVVAIRFHEIGLVLFEGTNPSSTFDVAVGRPDGTVGGEGNYYVNFWSSGKSLIAEFGLKGADGHFSAIMRSNVVELPPDAESPRYEDRRMRVRGAPVAPWKARRRTEQGLEVPTADAALASFADEDTRAWNIHGERISREPIEVAGPPAAEAAAAPKSPLAEAGSPTVVRELAAGSGKAAPAPMTAGDGLQPVAVVTAPRVEECPPAAEPGSAGWREAIGVSSLVLHGAGERISSLRRKPDDSQVRVEIKADIVIYGSARPGSEVFIDGVQVPVRDDGTFDVRFALPSQDRGGPEIPGGGGGKT